MASEDAARDEARYERTGSESERLLAEVQAAKQQIENILESVVETQQPIFIEEYYPPYDRWFENRIYPSKDGLAIFSHDITERKKTEEVLRACLRLSEFTLGHSLNELLTRTLDEAEALTGSQMGFFHFLDADQKTLSLQSWSTNTLQKMCTAEVKERHYAVDKAGVWVDCIRERRPVIHNDYADLPHRKGLPDGHAPVTRELVVPIIRGEQIVGVLGVGNKPGTYDEKDIEIVSRLANLTWDIVLSKQAEQEIATRVRQQTAVVELGQIALAGADVQTLMDKTAALVAQTLGVEYAKVLQLLPDDSALKLMAGVGWKEGLVGHATVGADRDSQAGYTLWSDQPVIMEDLRTETRFTYPPLLRDHGVVSGMSVVIRDTHQPFGVLGAHTTRRRRFTQDDVNFLQAAANVLAEAIRRQQAEEALREREARYNTLFNAVTDALFVHEVRADGSMGKFVEVNDVACQHLGYTRQELLNLSPVEIDAPDSGVDIKAIAPRVATGESVTFEQIHIAKDGRRIPVEIHAQAFQLNTQPAVMSLVRDITERKQGEDTLRQSHKQLRALTARLAEVEEAERKQLARELHDRIGQNLTALNINLNIVRGQLPADSAAQIGSRLDDSTRLVEETVARVRDVMAELRPPVLDDYGLAAALRWYAEQFTRRTEIPVSVEEAGRALPRLPSEIEMVLFRIAQESLTNVTRHARASHVSVQVKTVGNATRLTIADDGVGFDPAAIGGPEMQGWGLRTMRERVEAVGGSFRINTAPGKGTQIIVEIPP